MAIALTTTFIVTYFLHLTARVPALADMRLDLVLGVAAFVATFAQREGDKLRLGILTSRRLLFFVVYIILSLPLVTWPGSVIRLNLAVWIKAIFFFLLVVGAVRNERQLKLVVLVFLATQAFRVLEPLYLHVTTGYWGDIAYSHVGGEMSGLNRLSGSPYDIVNANQYGWVIVNTIPFLYYLFWQGNKMGKLIFMAALPCFVYALLLTGSRSSMLSLGVVVIGIVLVSENRGRNLLFAAALVIPAAVYMFSHADSQLQERYLSLVDSTVAGADTKQGRINGMVRQLGTLSYNPLFGNGLGTSGETNKNILGDNAQITHNLYIEILQETGIIGFALFVAYVATMVRALRAARRTLQELDHPDCEWLLRLISAVLVWICMDVVYSFSCFGVSSWEWYFFGGIASVCLLLVDQRVEEASFEAGEMMPEAVEG